ncbi:MAG TPA: SDR family NAD(P)-dependent oxidoreductase [Longimicrobiales bacterium]|nr:SDR family NAD(P)-dependent oxidoreductase [Longimicrobiales bacterium]
MMTASHPRRPGGFDMRPAVLVTGASKGIGAACTVRLAGDGFRVYAGVRREADGLALIGQAGDAVVPLQLDVTDAAQIAAAGDRIAADTGERGLQALVNNAGVALAGPLEFLQIDELRRQLEVNVTGQIAVTQACLPLLRHARASTKGDHRAGRIVFMSSVAGRSALPFMGAYAASKFALEAAADALRIELRPFGLTVSLVEPGVIDTPIWKTSRDAAELNIETMPPQLEEYYGTILQAMRSRVDAIKGLPPERVADVVAHALTARRPRTRYVVGRDARMRIVMQQLLPDRARDWIVAGLIARL